MNTPHAASCSEGQPLTLDMDCLHEVQGQDRLNSPSSTAVGTPAASIKLRAPTPTGPTPLPMGKLAILLMLNAVCPLAFELIYPFVNA